MRDYTTTLRDENARTGGRTITADTAYNAHQRTTPRRPIPSLSHLTTTTRRATRRALDTLTS